MDDAVQTLPFWDLPRTIQLRLLRYRYVQLLDVLTQGQVQPLDFAQELSADLCRLPAATLFQNGRPADEEHRFRFNIAQRKTYHRLVAPYRYKKRGQQVVSYNDPRWIDDEDAPDGRRLVRDDAEFQYAGLVPAAGNSEERAAVSRVDLFRRFDELERSYAKPIILAALGLITSAEAARALRMRKSRALDLMRRVKAGWPLRR